MFNWSAASVEPHGRRPESHDPRLLGGVPERSGGCLPSVDVPHGGHHRVLFPDGADHQALMLEQWRGQPVVEGQAFAILADVVSRCAGCFGHR